MATAWHVRVFEVRETRRGIFGAKKRVKRGYSWSASGDPEGYIYSGGPYGSAAAAEADARARIASEGGDVSSVTLP